MENPTKMPIAFIFLFAFFTFTQNASAGDAPYRICYFSLNNLREHDATSKFINELNRSTGRLVEVKEYQTSRVNPAQSFVKMIESGAKCDGLVISGHHTGAFGGKRSAGKLDITFLEKLSCDPKYSKFFQNINAAWLEGCRTLGIGTIAPDDQNREFDADYHTNRVGQDLERDGLSQTFANLNMEFSNTLDQDNPLDSRYLRVFPKAKIFGWTRSAPGENAQSELSFLYHMAQTSKLLEGENIFPSDKATSNNISAENATRYMNAVLLTLSKMNEREKGCEDLAVNAWLAHGRIAQGKEYAFDNRDLKALTSLNVSKYPNLEEAKQIDCMLKAAMRNHDEALINQTLNKIFSNQALLGYSFNSIVALYYSLIKEEKDPQAKMKKEQIAANLLRTLKDNPKLDQFLHEKMKKNQVGILRKIDYYRFYSNLTGKRDNELEDDILTKSEKIFLDPLPSEPPVNRRNAAQYRATVFQSIAKNNLLTTAFYKKLLDSNVEADILSSMAKQIDTLSLNKNAKQQILMSIASSKNTNLGVIKIVEPKLMAAGGSLSDIDQIRNALPTSAPQPGINFVNPNEKPQEQKSFWDKLIGN